MLPSDSLSGATLWSRGQKDHEWTQFQRLSNPAPAELYLDLPWDWHCTSLGHPRLSEVLSLYWG